MYSKQTINTSSQAVMLKRNKEKRTEQQNQQLKMVQLKKQNSIKNDNHISIDYSPATYARAVLFRDQNSYKKKINETSYKQLDIFEQTKELKIFGLGPYFFIQFQRRVVWLFFLFSFLQALCIVANTQGKGLKNYTGSFGSFLVITTIGNFDGLNQNFGQLYWVILIPALIFIIFFVFYIWWKCFYYSAILQQDRSKQFVKPQKFCLQIQGFSSQSTIKQQQLSQLFSVFGPIYQVSLAREYGGRLKYFQQLDELTQHIKQQQLQIILGSGDKANLKKKIKQRQQLIKVIKQKKIKPFVSSAFIHFQFQKSKNDMLEYFKCHYLCNQFISHVFVRNLCCLCIDDSKFYYQGHRLYIKAMKLPQPDDINWDSIEIGFCGKLFRVLVSFIVILAFLAISCAIIGLCSLIISLHSINCTSVDIPTSLAAAQSASPPLDLLSKKCFCNSNLIASFNSNSIKNYCGQLINQIYTEQSIQYAVAAVSTIINTIFGVVVKKLVDFTQPFSHSTGYLWRTSINTIFLILNTIFLPLFLYAEIFGVRPTKYVSFITIILSDSKQFFQIDSLQFYVDFELIWYRNVAPIFINYIIFDILLTWFFFIIYKCICTKQNLAQQQGTILQKTMNQKIISWQLNVSDQYANFNLIMFMAIFYCCGIPLLIPLAFINLLSKYVTNRALLQTLSCKIKGLGESFSAFPLFIIPIMLALSCLFGSWMLTGNPYINHNSKMQINTNIGWEVLNRQLILPYFFIIAIIVIFYFIFYNIIVRFFKCICNNCSGSKQVILPQYTHEYSFYARTMSILHSFNIKNNIKYKNAIINLQTYLETENINI